MFIPIFKNHVLTGIDVQRKPLGVDVIVTTLCGQRGQAKNLSFKFGQAADVGCVDCHSLILQHQDKV